MELEIAMQCDKQWREDSIA